MKYHYKAFNLHFITPFECPELIKIDEDNKLDTIIVSYSKLPNELENNLIEDSRYYQSNENEYLLNIKDIGKFLIRNKNEILIDVIDNIPLDTLKLFLFGSAIGALLHQRGSFPFHASGISTFKGAILFCGDSGAGKSTTLQAFLTKGYKKISDDTISLFYDEEKEQIMCIPSYPQSKIWSETAELFNHNINTLRQLNSNFDKFALLTHDKFDDRVVPLYKIFELNLSDEESVRVIEVKDKIEKLDLIIKNTYRYYYLDKLLKRKEHLNLAIKISINVRVYKVFRPRDKNSLDDILSSIEKNF